MAVAFPPLPVYPDAIDSDETLFLVFNTTETVITADNAPWSDEIEIKPQPPSKDEIWADNGFATISGELLYYDAVEKNINDRIFKLKNAVRNLGGSETQFNPEGTDIRSFVIAEHHNALVIAICAIEKLLGGDCDDTGTLICCLEELDVPDCPDDNNCPIVDFAFDIDNTVQPPDECTGTVINYTLAIIGTVGQFRLDFGDGTSTTSTQDGSHTYAPGVPIDPIVTASNDFCELVISGTERDEPIVPQVTFEDPFTFPVPSIVLPEISLTPIEVPSVDISLPPIVEPFIQLPSTAITITAAGADGNGNGGGGLGIPSVISVIPPDIPCISVCFGPAPTISACITIKCPTVSTVSAICGVPFAGPIWGDNDLWWDEDEVDNWIGVEKPNTQLLPEAIKSNVLSPEELKMLNPPQETVIEVPREIKSQTNIDEDILDGPLEININPSVFPDIEVKSDIPTDISLHSPEIPKEINVIGLEDFPSSVHFDCSDMPRSISVEAPDLPNISIEHDIPNVISVEGIPPTISIEGIPDHISVTGFPDSIKVDPVEVVVRVELDKLITDKDDIGQHCVAIVPCTPKS